MAEYNVTEYVADDVKLVDALESDVLLELNKGDKKVEHYALSKSVKTSVKTAFQNILKIVDEYKPLELDSLVNSIKREIVINGITKNFIDINNLTDSYWEELSWFKDSVSYKFNKRALFDDNDAKNEKSAKSAKVAKGVKGGDKNAADANANKKAAIYKKYDMMDNNSIGRVNGDYVDENGGTFMFSALNESAYYEYVSIDMVEEIFAQCFKKYLFGVMLLMWCNLVRSRYFCHIILHSNIIMDLMFNQDSYSWPQMNDGKITIVKKNPFSDPKYLEIIHKSLFYGLYILYREECLIRRKTDLGMRHLLDAAVVMKIPNYIGPLSQNPYITLTLSNKYLFTENILKPIKISNKYRGMYDLWNFQKRLDIFCGGILRDLDFDKIAIGGSCMAACLYINPLERLFGIEMPEENRMLYDLPPDKFAQKILNIGAYWDKNRENLMNYFNEYYPSKSVFEKYNINCESEISDIDVLIECADDDDFDRIAHRILKTVTKNASKSTPILIKCATNKSYKYNIIGEGLLHKFEIFRTYTQSIYSCISHFHFPLVRVVYTGNKIYIHPSALAAAYTGVLIDCKWFTNCAHPSEVTLKYYSRGYYPLINEGEVKKIGEWVKKHTEKWPIEKSTAEGEKFVSISSPIFKPSISRSGIYYELASNKDLQLVPAKNVYTWIPDNPDFANEWEVTKNTGNDVRYPAGHIKPCKYWDILPYFDSLNSSQKYFIQ
jgi:hypothetical protein